MVVAQTSPNVMTSLTQITYIPHTYEMTVIICHFIRSRLLRLEMGLTKGPTIVRVNKYYLGVVSVGG